MGEVRFMISEAAKQVKVESHVLRYWEEELDLVIGRTEMGHRYYTKDDIQLFRCIKKLKDEGMLLKDLKPLIPELKATRLKIQATAPQQSADNKSSVENQGLETGKAQGTIKNIKPAEASEPLQSTSTRAAAQKADSKFPNSKEPSVKGTAVNNPSAKDLSLKSQDGNANCGQKLALPAEKDKPADLKIAEADVIPITQLEQVRNLIGDVLTEVVTSNNEELKKDISKTVTKDVMREMDFLFQAKERQEEEHFRKLDCLIRQQQANRREAARETPIGKLKKLLN